MTETVEPMPVTEPWKKPWRWIPWDLHWHNATASGEPCEDPGCLVKHEACRPSPAETSMSATPMNVWEAADKALPILPWTWAEIRSDFPDEPPESIRPRVQEFQRRARELGIGSKLWHEPWTLAPGVIENLPPAE